eukprot:13863135-Alexandrium_andersonii.AAC.1
MSASLVGSEMCIRDSPSRRLPRAWAAQATRAIPVENRGPTRRSAHPLGCLLYTSDAADDM